MPSAAEEVATMAALTEEAATAISGRLSAVEGLYFPRDAPSDRKSALLLLLLHDPAIFLERYGDRLTDEELAHFDALRGDYEVEWHLGRIRDGRRAPTVEEARVQSARVKNRRRAYLNQLVRGGEYFSEEAMREREPYLHHEYVGRFQDPNDRCMALPGERWSETLMRRCEEAALVAKVRREQERLGMVEEEDEDDDNEEEEEEEEEEKEEEEEEEEEKDKEGEEKQHGEGVMEGGAMEEKLSPEELQEQMEQFTSVMQQRFLAGADSQHVDYSKIDTDERLDDHWVKEADLDAEDKYFSED